MSLSTVTNSPSFTVCSYRVPESGQCELDEDNIVNKRAHIYIVQSEDGINAEHIISRLRGIRYTVFPDLPQAATFIAFDPSRFKQISCTLNNAEYTCVTLLELMTQTEVIVSSVLTYENLNRPALIHNSQDRFSSALHLIAATFDNCQQFRANSEKFLKPLDMGNLVVKVPLEFFQDKIDRLVNPGFTAARVERFPEEECLAATFCTVHAKESLLSQLVSRITDLVVHAKHPLIASGRTALAQGCAATKALLSKPLYKKIACAATAVLLLNVPRLLNTLGLSLLHPMITVPLRVWIVYSAWTAKQKAVKTALVVASIAAILFSGNAPLLLHYFGAIVSIVLGSIASYTRPHPVGERNAIGTFVGAALVSFIFIETMNYLAVGELKESINMFSYEGMSS